MKVLNVLSMVFLAASVAHSAPNSTQWRVTQPAWQESHERQFGEFVAKIGQAVESRKCGKVDTCLKSAANPYFETDPSGLNYYADCADLPYYLRAYFAWKNELPFSILSGVKANLPEDGTPVDDIRYSTLGNYPVARFDVKAKSGLLKNSFPNALDILNKVVPGYTFSGNYRMLGNEDKDLFTDFYPAKINRQSIRPGSVIYDPAGHVAIVYKVSEDGRVFYIDAHPDNSLTMGMFTPKFSRSRPAQGAGFKNFRPIKLVDAKKDSSGAYIGGRVVAATNAELTSFGTEQFYGTQPDPGGSWSKGKFFLPNDTKALSYYDYVRLALTTGSAHIDPLKDLAQLADDICVSLKDRVAAVDSARAAGVTLKSHPDRLPLNIYGTEGEWENYATPSRDARLKVAFMDLLAQTKSNIEKYKQHDSSIAYSGGNIAKDLFEVYKQKAQECQVSYTTSNGKTVTMNLEAARQRVFAMSFDPYHCIEQRWGARLPEELASCTNDSNKNAWYEKEKWLRNQTERRYDARMDYALDEITGPMPGGVGVESAPDIDIVGYLKSQF